MAWSNLVDQGGRKIRINQQESGRMSTLAMLALVGLTLTACSDLSSPVGPRRLTPRFQVTPGSGTWATRAPMLTARSDVVAAQLNGVLYAVGGRAGPSGCTGMQTLEAYDPATNTWTTKAPMPTARFTAGAAALNGLLYVVSGDLCANRTGAVEAYNPASNTWTTRASLPIPVAGPGVVVVNGVLYAVGGALPNSLGATRVPTVQAYDPATDTWTTKAPMLTGRYAFAIGVVNGMIYVAGGEGLVEAYDPIANVWTSKAPMPTAHGEGLAGGVVNGIFYAVGGNGINTADAYDPASNSWSSAPPMSSARNYLGVAEVSGALYALGGFGPLATVEAFTPTAPTPTSLFFHGSGGTANPPTLSLNGIAPTSTTAKYQDSPSIKFTSGNQWTAVGTWTGTPSLTSGSLNALGDVQAWLGLKNSDDIGTNFDVRVEAYKNGSLFASGESHCIQGITRNPDLAKQVAVSFASFSAVAFNGTSDVLSLKVLTRIGTNGTGASCGGHSNAVGLRLYFDAVNRATKLSVSLAPVGDSWTTKTSMPTARKFLGVAANGGILYAVGGYNGGFLATLETYDPTTNAWTTKASMPTARYNLRVDAINGVLYAVGGTNGGELGTLEAYDPITNMWTTRASMPTARYGPGVVAINGILYAVGGVHSSNYVATVEAYDPTTNTWTTKASMPTAREGLGVTAINGILYAVGGHNGSSPDLATVEAYDPTTDTWTTKASMPTAREDLGITATGGILYAVGGQNNGDLATVEAYDPTTNTWTTKASMPTARYGLGVAAINGVVYAVGGVSATIEIGTVEAYQP